MSEIRDYRANLSLCWRMAEQAPSEPERRAWLDIAECWRLLVITDDGSSTGEPFDAPRGRTAFRDRLIGGVHCRLIGQWRRHYPKYRLIREKARSLLGSFGFTREAGKV